MPNNTLHKLIIKGVRSSGLVDYLEEICEKEHVKVLDEYEDSYDILNSRTTFYGLNNLSKSDDYVIMSYNYEKLLFIQHLYNTRLDIVTKLEDMYADDSSSSYNYNKMTLDQKMYQSLINAGWVGLPKFFYGEI